MKQFSLLAGLLFCATAVLAQRPSEEVPSMTPQPVSMQEAALAKQNGVPSMSQSRGGGEVFVETFANGLAGTSGNGA